MTRYHLVIDFDQTFPLFQPTDQNLLSKCFCLLNLLSKTVFKHYFYEAFLYQSSMLQKSIPMQIMFHANTYMSYNYKGLAIRYVENCSLQRYGLDIDWSLICEQ